MDDLNSAAPFASCLVQFVPSLPFRSPRLPPIRSSLQLTHPVRHSLPPTSSRLNWRPPSFDSPLHPLQSIVAMASQGASLQSYNQELVKCLEDLREKREILNKTVRGATLCALRQCGRCCRSVLPGPAQRAAILCHAARAHPCACRSVSCCVRSLLRRRRRQISSANWRS